MTGGSMARGCAMSTTSSGRSGGAGPSQTSHRYRNAFNPGNVITNTGFAVSMSRPQPPHV